MSICSKGNILITGTSSGIGEAGALHLAGLGFQVFAGVREQKAADNLHGKNIDNLTPVYLDITNEAMINNTYELIAERTGNNGLYGLINNASIAFGAPIECAPMEQITRLFEVDVFGPIRVIRKFLPLIRKAKGRIINIGSIASGQLSFPFLSTLSAAKSALDSFSKTLRLELRPWSIPVSVVKPGNIDTALKQKIVDSTTDLFANFPLEEQKLYKPSITAYLDFRAKSEHHSISPDLVAKKLERILTVKKPRAVYIVGKEAFFAYHLLRHFPAICEIILAKHIMKLPKKGSMVSD